MFLRIAIKKVSKNYKNGNLFINGMIYLAMKKEIYDGNNPIND